jgi:hypothetical protein
MYEPGLTYDATGPRGRTVAMTMARIAALQSTLGWVAPMATRPAITQHKADGSTVAFDAKQQKPKARAKAQRAAKPAKPAKMTAEQFYRARLAACDALAAEVGPNWHLIEGATLWGSVPSRLRKIKSDVRLPVARYWAGGLPDGVVLFPDMPRDRTPRHVVLKVEADREVIRAERAYKAAYRQMGYARDTARRSYWDAESRQHYQGDYRAAIRTAWEARGTWHVARILSAAEAEAGA